eukprot:5895993-Pleurochrysis_carterae.AAC.2
MKMTSAPSGSTMESAFQCWWRLRPQPRALRLASDTRHSRGWTVGTSCLVVVGPLQIVQLWQFQAH